MWNVMVWVLAGMWAPLVELLCHGVAQHPSQELGTQPELGAAHSCLYCVNRVGHRVALAESKHIGGVNGSLAWDTPNPGNIPRQNQQAAHAIATTEQPLA